MKARKYLDKNEKVIIKYLEIRRRKKYETCVSPILIHQSIMIWACVSKKGMGTLTDKEGKINARKYCEILDNIL